MFYFITCLLDIAKRRMGLCNFTIQVCTIMRYLCHLCLSILLLSVDSRLSNFLLVVYVGRFNTLKKF